MSEPTTVKQLLDLGTRVLEDSSHIFDDHIVEAEARELLARCLDVDVDDLDDDAEPTRRTRERYLSLIARRAGGEPFPFLMGFIEFWGLELKVTPGAFVPRPSSELTVELAVNHLKRKKKPIVVDVCTGAGPIALAIADEFPSAEVFGADISEEGLSQGRKNAKRLGISNVKLKRGDMYGPLPTKLQGRVDLITGHVPYVHLDEIEDLPAEVREFEPLFTLSDQSDDGLGLMRRAVFESIGWLKPGGWLLLETAEDLGPKITRMFKKAGFDKIGTRMDEDRLSIVVEGTFPRS
ncbi:MAG: N5-glutamine methyltransferase family protein [Actinomycetota bacterium]